jgi:anti-sigma B factor antagonist
LSAEKKIKMDKLTIAERHYKTVTILDLAGKIRIGDGNIKLRAALRLLVESGKKNILLNLADVSHIDSSGLGELVAGFVSLEKNDGQLKLLNLNYRVRELMLMTKLLTIFDVFENEDEAVASFQILSENIEPNQSTIVTNKLNEASANL